MPIFKIGDIAWSIRGNIKSPVEIADISIGPEIRYLSYLGEVFKDGQLYINEIDADINMRLEYQGGYNGGY